MHRNAFSTADKNVNLWNEQQVEHAWEVLVRFCKRGRRISSASRASSTLPFSSLSMFAIVLTAENDVRMLQQYSELLKLMNLVKGNCWSMLLATMEETPLQKLNMQEGSRNGKLVGCRHY
jgi:hypothetical protein